MSEHFEIAVIGAGPAGLSAAATAAQHQVKHVLFERKEIGNTVYEYQLRKLVMAEPQKLPLRSPVPFSAGSREQVLEGWNKVVQDLNVNVRKAEVTKIEKSGENFLLTHSGGTCTAKNVVLGIGVQGTPRKLGVPGEAAPHVAYTLSDPDAFKGKNIIIVGAGDAAIENALALCEANRVSLINLSDDFPRAKEANAAKITDAIKMGQIHMYSNASIARIEGALCFINTPEGEVEAKCDQLIVRIGGTLPRSFLEASGVKFPSADPFAVPAVSSRYESNVGGLFILGALIGYPLIKQGINQGYEVVQHILGKLVEPADQVLIVEALKDVAGDADENLRRIRAALPLFAELSDAQFRELIIESKIHQLKPGGVVFERNDYTDTFFSLVSGEVQIELQDGRFIPIQAGNFFGEMGLLSGRRRVATVKVSKDAFLLESPRKQILKLMKSVTSVKRALDEVFMLRALETSVFPNTNPVFLKNLVTKAKMKSFKKNEVLFQEGDVGDVLYVIRKGSVKISSRSPQGTNVTKTYVPAGHVVGEMALLRVEDTPRSATATAAVACETIVIEKKDFQELLSKSSEVKKRIEEIANARRVQNLKTDTGAASGALLDFMMREGVTDADNILVINSDLCIGCDNCEKACEATHGGNSRLDRKGGKSFASIQIPVSCRHCENPLCMTDCPPDALTRLPDGEVVIMDSCIGCGNCVRNCPYGVIQLVHDHEETTGFSLAKLLGFGEKKHVEGPAKAAKCDLCQSLSSGPACVRSCPTGAAVRVNPKHLLQMVQEKS